MASDGGLLFLGSKALGLDVLKTVVAIVPDELKGVITVNDVEDDRSVLTGFKEYCAKTRLDLKVLNRPEDLEAVVAEMLPAVILVSGWYWMIDGPVLNMAPNGFVGLHASLLPAYRGNAPLVWALINGESKTGITLFFIDRGMDTGDIIDQVELSIGPNTAVDDLLTRTTEACCDLIERHLGNVLDGTAPRRPQNEDRASYGSARTQVDGRIDWKRSAGEVHNFIRAQSHPYPGAFTNLEDGRRLRIWKCELFGYSYSGIPGLAQQAVDAGRVVCCGSGAVVVTDCTVDAETADDPRTLITRGTRCT